LRWREATTAEGAGLISGSQANAGNAAFPLRAERAGVAACRNILDALESAPGQAPVAPIDPSQIAAVVGALRGIPADKLLDVAIAQLRPTLPAGADVPAAPPINLHLVPVPGPRKP